LAVVLNKVLTLFLFKQGLNLLEFAPVQIEFLGNIMAIRFANKRVNFYQIKVNETNIMQIFRIEVSNVQCELMIADNAGKKIVLLNSNELWLFHSVAGDITLVPKKVLTDQTKFEPNAQMTIAKSSQVNP
jgi:predicted metalloenzyme YecM